MLPQGILFYQVTESFPHFYFSLVSSQLIIIIIIIIIHVNVLLIKFIPHSTSNLHPSNLIWTDVVIDPIKM